MLTYALFADGQADPDDFGATHPAVQARAAMGPASWPRWTGRRASGSDVTGSTARRPSNGGWTARPGSVAAAGDRPGAATTDGTGRSG